MLHLEDKYAAIAAQIGFGDIEAGVCIALEVCSHLGINKMVRKGRPSASRKFPKDNPKYIIDRESARALGFTLYRTGLECRRGHTGWRYVSTGNCVECHDRK